MDRFIVCKFFKLSGCPCHRQFANVSRYQASANFRSSNRIFMFSVFAVFYDNIIIDGYYTILSDFFKFFSCFITNEQIEQLVSFTAFSGNSCRDIIKPKIGNSIYLFFCFGKNIFIKIFVARIFLR